MLGKEQLILGKDLALKLEDEESAEKSIIPTDFESAFQLEIQQKFGAALSEPIIDGYGVLIRVSDPLPIGDKFLAFQYKRFDPADTIEYLAALGIDSRYGGLEPDEWEVAREQARKIVKDRDGIFDQTQVLTNPNYYSSVIDIEQWPQQVGFLLLKNNFDPNKQLESVKTSSKGRIGEIANMYGTLNISCMADGFPMSGNYGELLVEFPDYVATLFRKSFKDKDLGKEYSTFKSSIPLEPIQKTMNRFVAFANELTKIK